jgi:catechol 2,3-dioxygenase-like lactoylglutathione lyase family enzyme
MIIGAHLVIYAADAKRTRAFGRDVLGFANDCPSPRAGTAHTGFGLLATLNVPGGGKLGLYQPRHAMATNLPD